MPQKQPLEQKIRDVFIQIMSVYQYFIKHEKILQNTSVKENLQEASLQKTNFKAVSIASSESKENSPEENLNELLKNELLNSYIFKYRNYNVELESTINLFHTKNREFLNAQIMIEALNIELSELKRILGEKGIPDDTHTLLEKTFNLKTENLETMISKKNSLQNEISGLDAKLSTLCEETLQPPNCKDLKDSDFKMACIRNSELEPLYINCDKSASYNDKSARMHHFAYVIREIACHHSQINADSSLNQIIKMLLSGADEFRKFSITHHYYNRIKKLMNELEKFSNNPNKHYNMQLLELMGIFAVNIYYAAANKFPAAKNILDQFAEIVEDEHGDRSIKIQDYYHSVYEFEGGEITKDNLIRKNNFLLNHGSLSEIDEEAQEFVTIRGMEPDERVNFIKYSKYFFSLQRIHLYFAINGGSKEEQQNWMKLLHNFRVSNDEDICEVMKQHMEKNDTNCFKEKKTFGFFSGPTRCYYDALQGLNNFMNNNSIDSTLFMMAAADYEQLIEIEQNLGCATAKKLYKSQPVNINPLSKFMI